MSESCNLAQVHNGNIEETCFHYLANLNSSCIHGMNNQRHFAFLSTGSFIHSENPYGVSHTAIGTNLTYTFDDLLM